jgi:hypothetical protein
MKQDNSLDKLTKQYQISKTLRFELKPLGKTSEWIKKHDIIGVEEDHLIGKDAEVARHYKYAKRLLDEMHRAFIEDALNLKPGSEAVFALNLKMEELNKSDDVRIDSELRTLFKDILDKCANIWIKDYCSEMPKFWKKDIIELQLKINSETNNQRKKGFKSAVNAIKKKIDNPEKSIKKKNIEVMFSNEDAMHLLEWTIRTGVVKGTFKELEQGDNDNFIPVNVLTNYLRNFNKFYTYFSGFNENRANVYDIKGDKSTSIIYRIFNDNFKFHISNIKKWETVKKSLIKYEKEYLDKNYEWSEKLVEIESLCGFSLDELFSVKNFILFVNQGGITRYNEYIGGLPKLTGDKKVQGINEFINLCRQQVNGTRQQFPPLQEMFKQILSKSENVFIKEFNDDRDLLDGVNNFHNEYFEAVDEKPFVEKRLDEFQELIKESNQEKNKLFISKDKISYISQQLTGQWNNINLELLEILGETKFNREKYFSFSQIENALNIGLKNEIFIIDKKYLKSEGILFSFFTECYQKQITECSNNWKILQDSKLLDQKEINKNRSNQGDKGFEQVAMLKAYLDSAIALTGFLKNWNIDDWQKSKPETNKLWYEKIASFTDSYSIIKLYNMVRNHITQKPSSSEKIKINFENSTLLDGWDRNKESDNYGIILEKNGLFYLGLMTPESNKIFDYEILESDSAKKKKEKRNLTNVLLTNENTVPFYRKVNYKLLPGANKMLPKVFFAKSNASLFKPSQELLKIKNEKLYTKASIEKHGIVNLHKYIDFCIKSLSIHPEWSKSFGFSKNCLKQALTYNSIDEFYRDVEDRGYKLSFDKIKESYINEKVNSGELYLFQIYSKDFSVTKKGYGKDNLHTSYWKLLFNEENLNDTVLKLNGQAEIFFRKASVKYSAEKLKTGHHAEKLEGKFSYPIIKNKRFTEDKFFFHSPITLNTKVSGSPGNFNNKIRWFLKNNPDVNIIGIDRGEKHLLYYSVINQSGKIIEQGSLNKISNGFIPKGESSERRINYHEKLGKMQESRDKARKSWGVIENIKEMKAGYLSQVIHKLSQLIVDNNAIVVLEDLNIGFKRGRFGVEKQVYQKFEKALIDKLNYLVFKDKTSRLDPGHYLNAYQLTNKFESFQKIGKQTGILFYTTASYTSTTDPVTGFLKNVYSSYSSIEKSVKFWNSFDSIFYNSKLDRFEFAYTIGCVDSKSIQKETNEDQLTKNSWTVCSCVERSRYIKQEQSEAQKLDTTSEQIGNKGYHEVFLVTDKIKKTLMEASIDYKNCSDIKSQLMLKKSKADKILHKSMLYLFNSIMNMRVTDGGKDKGTHENDFILSPVEPFFDTRKQYGELPENGDANGAYNIARKGICILNKINNIDDLSKVNPSITKQEWLEYCQNDLIQKTQLDKL